MTTKTLAELQEAAASASEALAADPENKDLQAAAAAALAELEKFPALPPAAKAEKQVELRVLLDYLGHRVDDVIKLSSSEAKAAVEAGWADDNKKAVAFAKAEAKGH